MHCERLLGAPRGSWCVGPTHSIQALVLIREQFGSQKRCRLPSSPEARRKAGGFCWQTCPVTPCSRLKRYVQASCSLLSAQMCAPEARLVRRYTRSQKSASRVSYRLYRHQRHRAPSAVHVRPPNRPLQMALLRCVNSDASGGVHAVRPLSWTLSTRARLSAGRRCQQLYRTLQRPAECEWTRNKGLHLTLRCTTI